MESKPRRGQGLPAKQLVRANGCGSCPLLSATIEKNKTMKRKRI